MTYAAVHVKDARIDIRITSDLLARVDARRGVLGQSRTVFIERALEAALGSASVQASKAGIDREQAATDGARPVPASPRVSTERRGCVRHPEAGMTKDGYCAQPGCSARPQLT